MFGVEKSKVKSQSLYKIYRGANERVGSEGVPIF